MSRYCNNRECDNYKNREPMDDSVNFCGLCGGKTVAEEPAVSSLIGGTANAVHTVNSNSNNTSYNTTDSHNTSIGSISSGNVTHNTTIIVDSATAEKLSSEEKLRQYQTFCEASITNGLITKSLRDKLDAKANELSIDQEARRAIESCIREKTSISTYVLSDLDRSTLYNIAELIKANAESNDLLNCISKLKPLATKSDEDDVHHYLNLLLAVTNPSLLIRNYLERTTDSYWQTFWTYAAYIKNGQREKAETIRAELSAWEEYSQDNIKILYCFGELFPAQTSRILIDNIRNTFKECSYYSPQLEGLHAAIKQILSIGSGGRSLSGEPSIDFYLGKLWGIKPQQNRSVAYGSSANNGIQQKSGGGTQGNIGQTTGGKTPQPNGTQTPRTNPPRTTGGTPTPPTVTPVVPHKKNRTPLYIGVGVAALAALFLFLRSSESETVTEKSITEVTKLEDNTGKKPEQNTTTTGGGTGKGIKKNPTPTEAPNEQDKGQKEDPPKEEPKPEPKPEPVTPKSPSAMTCAEALSAGRKYLRNGDFDNAANYFKSAADRGSAEAQYEIAMLYKTGSGVAKSTANAFTYMKSAAEAGFTKAYRELGEMYHGGRGTTKDRSQAEYWYKKAVQAGDQKAQKILNNM